MTKAEAKAPPADILRYLKATGLIELRYIRKLSSLCAQTYYIRKLTVRLLRNLSAEIALLSYRASCVQRARCAQWGWACSCQLCLYLPLGASARDAGRPPFEGPGAVALTPCCPGCRSALCCGGTS